MIFLQDSKILLTLPLNICFVTFFYFCHDSLTLKIFHDLFNLYAEYIMWNTKLDTAQAGVKIARRNTNNLRYVDDTTLMGESEEELKSLLMKVKEESEKAGLSLNIQKTKLMANRCRNSGNSGRLYFWGLQNHCRWWLQPWN